LRQHLSLIPSILVSSILCVACEPTDKAPSNESDITEETGGTLITDENTPNSAGSTTAISDEMNHQDQNIDSCIPDADQWTDIKETITGNCGLCHGDTPQFGAPFSLTQYEHFSADRAKESATSLSDGTMPPAGQPSLHAEERMKLYSWLTCGDVGESPEPLPAGGFSSSRPLLDAPNEIPDQTDFFEVKADGFNVPSRRNDRYECFTIQAPISENRFIRRVETIVDDARVLHHIVVIPESGGRAPGTHSECDDDNPFAMIYAWAPGQGALHFAEGGIRLSPGQAITLQIHYNNSAQYEDVNDQSGVRIYHGPVAGPEVAVLTLGPMGFEVAPRTREAVSGYCELSQDTKIIASFPHMHEKGVQFEQSVTRNWLGQSPDDDSTWEDIITLDGWDFESQYIYDTPITLSRGDLIKTTCVYENTTDEVLRFGQKTKDEMCFNFAYISPPISVDLCNQSSPPSQVYLPGECAPEEAQTWAPPPVEVRFEVAEEQAVIESVPLPNGQYWLDEAIAFIPNNIVEQYRFDLVQSGARGRGVALWSEGNQLTLDLNSEMRLVAVGLSFTERFDLSLSGTLTPHQGEMDDPLNGSYNLENSCGQLENGQLWVTPDPAQGDEQEIKGGWLAFPINFGPFELVIHAHLTRTD
jgi:hypothetical protein